jgi:hypothetical protein
MPLAKPRDRVVVFRLTEDEYAALKNACSERGERSLSAFTRSELLACARHSSLHDTLDSRFSVLEERLTELKEELEQICRLLRSGPPPRIHYQDRTR